MHRHNAGMIEIGNCAGLGQICLGIFGLGDQLGVRHLDGNQPIQLLVMGQIDETEAPFAQHLFDAIATNLFERLSGCSDLQKFRSLNAQRRGRCLNSAA